MQLPPLATPALVVDAAAFAHNVATMAAARPGTQCRPHVKAFKSTALAQQLHQAGHVGFCAATPREIVGMAAAGLDEDLLLANQCLDPVRLAALANRTFALIDECQRQLKQSSDLQTNFHGDLRSRIIFTNGVMRCSFPISNPAIFARRLHSLPGMK